jgi:fluoroacetyl-CoA thioesterase
MTDASAELTATVGAGDTAAGFGAHFPAAASTPFVLGLAEVACHNAVATTLAVGEVTVGARVVIEHLAPSPVGAVLRARARLTERDGRRLRFEVEVFDGDVLCATVTHDRVVVLAARIDELLARRSGGSPS